jgi:hypothetical protein
MPAGNGTILVVRDQVQFQRLLIQGRKENPLHLGILREHGLVYLSGEGVVQQLDKGTTTVLRSARPATSDRLRSFCRWFLSERRGGIVAVDNPVFDFGVVDQNTEVKHTFVVKNAGEDTLALTGMKSSCGCNPYEISARVEEIAQTGRMCNCIEAKASKMRIAPGESSEIESSCWLALSPGNQESVVTIQTNDRENPLLKLRMVGKVRARVVFSPEYLMFDKAVVGQEFRKALSIRNPGPEPMEISGLKVVPANALSVAVGSDTTPAFPIRLDEGQEMPLTVKLLIPSDWPTKKQVTEVWEQGQGKRSVVLPSFFGVFQIVTAGADPEPKNLRLIIQARME